MIPLNVITALWSRMVLIAMAAPAINSSTAAETGPWLSEDGHYIIFSSNRSGYRNLYEATR